MLETVKLNIIFLIIAHFLQPITIIQALKRPVTYIFKHLITMVFLGENDLIVRVYNVVI